MCFTGPIARHCSQCRSLIREDPTYRSYCYSMVLTRQCNRQVVKEPFEWTHVFKDVCAECKAGEKGGRRVTNTTSEKGQHWSTNDTSNKNSPVTEVKQQQHQQPVIGSWQEVDDIDVDLDKPTAASANNQPATSSTKSTTDVGSKWSFENASSSSESLEGTLSQVVGWNLFLIFAVIVLAFLLSAGSAPELAVGY